ncbi:vWA domain-containing protein [Terriglobus tenax]|uniref:hypothetical protein n=1 Tax=Terriglobus tenax TaxID=1111115 RepID=UPI0021DF60A1|nr:hypothetical protein [Terriglobus tenax]
MRWLSVALLGLVTASAVAQVEGPVTTSALVRVEDKRGPEAPRVQASEVTIKLGDADRRVTGWQPVLGGSGQGQGTGVELAILIDDGLQTGFGRMLSDLQSFIQSLPPDVAVTVGYMQNGRVVAEQEGFTTEHDDAAKALRLPRGMPGVSASPYFCLSDFVKHWQPSGKARIALMITSGVDPYNGSTSPMNQYSPYVETAKADAQRAGVAVYSIYYTGAALRGGQAAFSGQNYLTDLAASTGARSYYIGTGNPVSFRPFLKQFTDALYQTYRVQFDGGGKGLQRFKASAKGVKLTGPQMVLAGAH